jgi:hypothetical protein
MNGLLEFGAATWLLTAEMAPYLLFGFLVAGLLSAWLREESVAKYLGGRGFGATLRAALIGVPMPLCSCGVIPVAASLRRHGAGRGAAVCFLASTPQTGVDSIAATWGLLGPLFAGIRVAVAFVTGLVAGTATDLIDRREDAPRTGGEREASAPPEPFGKRVAAALRYGFVTLPGDIGRSLLLGLLLAGLIAVLLPDSMLGAQFKTGWPAYLAALAISVPLYVCSTGSIPLAAAMVAAGVSPGAALIFLIAGPATNIATITTTLRTLGTRATAAYLASIVGCSLAAGLLLDAALPAGRMAEEMHRHAEGVAPFHHASAALLLAVIGFAFATRARGGREAAGDEGGNDLQFEVEGMTCSHCAATVEKAALSVPGVKTARVSLPARRVTIDGPRLDPDRIASSIREAGFGVRQIDPGK